VIDFHHNSEPIKIVLIRKPEYEDHCFDANRFSYFNTYGDFFSSAI